MRRRRRGRRRRRRMRRRRRRGGGGDVARSPPDRAWAPRHSVCLGLRASTDPGGGNPFGPANPHAALGAPLRDCVPPPTSATAILSLRRPAGRQLRVGRSSLGVSPPGCAPPRTAVSCALSASVPRGAPPPHTGSPRKDEPGRYAWPSGARGLERGLRGWAVTLLPLFSGFLGI